MKTCLSIGLILLLAQCVPEGQAVRRDPPAEEGIGSAEPPPPPPLPPQCLVHTVSARMSRKEYDSFVEFHDWGRKTLLEAESNFPPEMVDSQMPVWTSSHWTAWGEDMGDVYLVLLRTSSGALMLSYFEGYSVEAIRASLDGIAQLKPSSSPVEGFADGGVWVPLALEPVFPRLVPKIQEHYRKGGEQQGNGQIAPGGAR
jgi:hypothetical protein